VKLILSDHMGYNQRQFKALLDRKQIW